MTMETNGSNETESTRSTDASDSKVRASSTAKVVKKPPGQIDPSEYEVENDDNELYLGDTSAYSIEQRNFLFQRALDFEKKEKSDLALECYLGCLKGLKNKTRFALLPECLNNIADIYHAKGEYEKAIHFAQAEKLFYETALIETQEIQRKIEEVTTNLNVDGPSPQDLNDLNIEALRAEEFEHLARLCLDNKQPQLALEYAGKCAKIRQTVYGNDHVKTKETLDFFASLYAEVGKEQYADSITFLTDGASGDLNRDEGSNVPVFIGSTNEMEEPISILRQRSVKGQKADGDKTPEIEKEKKQVRFHESVDDAIKLKKKEELISLTITLLLLVVCFLILISLGVWLYCTIDRNQSCPTAVAKLKSFFNIIHYNVNRLTTSTSQKIEYSR